MRPEYVRYHRRSGGYGTWHIKSHVLAYSTTIVACCGVLFRVNGREHSDDPGNDPVCSKCLRSYEAKMRREEVGVDA